MTPAPAPIPAGALGAGNPMAGEPGAEGAVVPVADDGMEFLVGALVRIGGFALDAPDIGQGVATATRTRSQHYGFRASNTERLTCRWCPDPGDPARSLLAWVVKDSAHHPLAADTHVIGTRYLPAALQSFLDREQGWAPARDPVVAPGGSLEGSWTGQMLDLGGMATEAELCPPGRPESLDAGTLPLGRYAWGYPADGAASNGAGTRYGRRLHLGRFGDEPMQYRGTLVCAPPGAGKTELILRWAVAAIAQGQSVLVVDVKGGLKDEIVRRLEHAGARLPAATFFFSTNPEPGTFSDRINFLAGLDATTPVGRVELEQVARAILPSDGFDQGEELRLYQNRLAYLTAMLGLVSLRRDYEPHPDGRDYDLSDVHAMAAREQTLYDWITRVAGLEARRRAAGQEPHEPGLRHWFDELAILLRGEWRVGAGEDAGVLVGQRADRDPYRYFTQGIVNALEPFAARGVLGRKVSGAPLRRGDGVFFRLDQLLEPAQVVMILEARELDVGSAEAVVSLAVTHLQLLLNRRHGQAGARPILLLLDETARLRGFDAKKYVALCRSAQAGVVLVYQQLEQIARRPGEERTVSELLENVGTQIYLGSLAGRNYELFSAQRGTRWQSSFTRTAGARSSHREQQITQVERSDVPLFARIPAGRFPALVYIRDHPCHKPFLVDLDRDDPAAPRDTAPDPADPGRLSLPPTARRLLADAARRGGQPGG